MKFFSAASWIGVPALIVCVSWILIFIWQATPWWSPGIDSNCFRRFVCTFTVIFSFIVYLGMLGFKDHSPGMDALEKSSAVTMVVAGIFVLVE